LDPLGNTDVSFTGDVTVSLGTNPGGGFLGGTLTVGAVNGVASFGDLTVSSAGTGYTLVASGPVSGAKSATSTAFDLTTPSTSARFAARPRRPSGDRASVRAADARGERVAASPSRLRSPRSP